MKTRKSYTRLGGFVAMVMGIGVFSLFAAVGFAGVTPDFRGVDTVEVKAVEKKDPSISVGAGIAAVPEYEGSEDLEAVPLLFARAAWNSGRYVQFLASTLKANVIASETWSFGPLARYRSERDDDVENDAVKLMREVDEAIEIGAFAGFKTGNWHASFQAANDVNDAHDGLVLTLDGGYMMPLDEAFKLDITVFTTYADDDYMETYFSVDADNASRSGLPQYTAESGIKDFGGMLNLAYAPCGDWGITGILGFKRLVGDAEDSPVVDEEGDENQFFGGIMASYRF